ncbi:hypothetical protein K7711_18855 [Nocardia sp. CA2R105]|uniref:hypothetical protein n=1 Tax=Nocardia coffeae TaxID=2873381 RepID=UPI001CA7B1E4|nr:hypothetical protein [Nocardia coffeae]MBY8858546.1 hypothetical protein [Nocardia coffeae]
MTGTTHDLVVVHPVGELVPGRDGRAQRLEDEVVAGGVDGGGDLHAGGVLGRGAVHRQRQLHLREVEMEHLSLVGRGDAAQEFRAGDSVEFAVADEMGRQTVMVDNGFQVEHRYLHDVPGQLVGRAALGECGAVPPILRVLALIHVLDDVVQGVGGQSDCDVAHGKSFRRVLISQETLRTSVAQ